MLPLPCLIHLLSILRNYKKEKNLCCALSLIFYFDRTGHHTHPGTGNSIVAALVRPGYICNALRFFDRLRIRSKLSWNSLIDKCIAYSSYEDALFVYHKMREDSVYPSDRVYVALLNLCAKHKDVSNGCQLHVDIAKSGLLKTNQYVGNTLVNMYAKCGLLAKARDVFDILPERDVVTWTALIGGYAQLEHGEAALQCYEKMVVDGVFPNAVTYSCTLKACGSIKESETGMEIHANVERKGLLTSNVYVANALVDMYAKCGSLKKAQEVFDGLPTRDIISWNALIGGYVLHNADEKAFKLFELMQLEGMPGDAVTHAYVLKACGNMQDVSKGEDIHYDVKRKGLLKANLIVGNALVDMYMKFGMMEKACETFKQLPAHDVVSWNTMMVGYTENECSKEALECFEKMQHEGIRPDIITYSCCLKACAYLEDPERGGEIHSEIVRLEMLENNKGLSSSLVDMYAKSGWLWIAKEVFDTTPVRDTIAWTALIAGYVQHSHDEDALCCFVEMQSDGVSPDAALYACIVKACGSVGACDEGEQIHAEIARMGLLETDVSLDNALVDMYVRFDMLEKACDVFQSIPVRDMVSWSAMTRGYAQVGDSENVFFIFDKMREAGIKPDPITFVCILHVCSHAGLINKAQAYFGSMIEDYNITPTSEHYTCLVDLLGRAGQLERAVHTIEQMPFYPNIVMWHTVLGACRKWDEVDLGRHAFEQAVRLDVNDTSAYVSLYNIYANCHILGDEVKRMESKLLAQSC